jgi:N-acetylgalactosamine-N,N'-diacetylbacillosaminyl-diphospho-undecaprenol 4-alpha-N-acetylgalactosaminyltransferase
MSGGRDGPLRLLLVTHSLGGGGAERFAVNLAGALDRGRFAPALCAATGRVDYPAPPGVPVAALDYRGLATLPAAILRLRRRIAAERPDLVLSNVLATNALTGAALAGLADPPPWIARIGNAPGIGEPRLHRWWARRAYRRARSLVCNSRGMAEAFARVYPGSGDRIESLGNPTDFAELERRAAEPVDPAAVALLDPTAAAPVDLTAAAPLGPRPAPGAGPILLAVGRLTRQKRPDLMLEALARVRRRPGLEGARLWLCGEGPLAGSIARRARRLGLGDAVALLGFVANPFALMRRADLFLLTSDFEGLPNALIEAQGLGLPAVATRCPHGPDEIVEDGATGLLAPTGDAEEVAAAAADLLADPARRRRMGEAAAARARRLYDAAVLVPAWERLLLAAAGRSVSNSVQ